MPWADPLPAEDIFRTLVSCPPVPTPDPFLGAGSPVKSSAQYVGISPSKFDELRKDGRIGPPRLIDGRKVWDIFELDQSFDAFPVEGGASDEDWQSAV